MQLFALDDEHKPIDARSAIKQKDYVCLECLGVVRARRGPHRHPHYYHLNSTSTCRQNGKSIEHLLAQQKLYAALPLGDVHLEYRINSIGRIADVLWVSQKIVFEIQCSPLSGIEVISRNHDYQKEGYSVVWIFHDSTFNQRLVSSAEQSLQTGYYYFTNIDASGHGSVYDQYEIFRFGKRKVLSEKYEVTLSSLIESSTYSFRPHRQFYFKGDLVDRILTQEIVLPIDVTGNTSIWNKWFLKPYRILLQVLLEKACR